MDASNPGMRIMHVIDSLAVGGAERMLVEIANQSARDGHDVYVCITRSEASLAVDLDPKIRLYEMGRRNRFEWDAMAGVSRFIRDAGIQVLHVHGRTSYLLVLVLKMVWRVRPFIVFHDHLGCGSSRPASFWMRLSTHLRSCHYVAVSNPLAEWAIKTGFEPNRVTVIPNALDLTGLPTDNGSDVRSEFGIARETPLGVTVAGLRYEKGVDDLIRAASSVASHFEFKLLVIGGDRDDRYAASCRRSCAELGLDQTLLFTGERDDVPSILRQVDFAVIPSRSESGPLVLIEYMAAGLPFVATRTGNVAESVEAAGLPEFVEPGDPHALAGAMERLLSMSPAERRRRGSAGPEMADQYDIRVRIAQWYGVYGSLVART